MKDKAKKPTTGKHSVKPYRCTGCGSEKEFKTNHWGAIYPYCSVCVNVTVWVCEEPLPEGYDIPEPWDIVEIKNMEKP
jgi:hypothetical protein